jgi:Lon protease-like protein
VEELLPPLFPLEVVPLPGELLALHIFEERYKQMIGECLAAATAGKSRGNFGVVLAKDGAISDVGCTAHLEKVTRQYEDGRMDILTAGRRRFEILLTNEEKPCLRAGVDCFDDDAGFEAGASPDAERAISLFGEILRLLKKSMGRPVLGEGYAGRPPFCLQQPSLWSSISSSRFSSPAMRRSG